MNEKSAAGWHEAAGDAEIRRVLLAAAHRHAQRGETYLATARYLKLLAAYPGTLEGQEARAALLEIAQKYEAEGKRYHALSVYDKLAGRLAAGKPSGHQDGSLDNSAKRAVARAAAEGIQAPTCGATDEIPFVDLTEEVRIAQNFNRLGRVQRVQGEVLHRTVDLLARLKARLPDRS